jgi:hypothetical protein
VALRLHEVLASGLLLALPIAAIALNCTTTNTIVPGCSDLCLSQLPCWQTLGECADACTNLKNSCTLSGHPSAFAAYATCAGDAGFTCIDGGPPTVNAPCGPQQSTLEQCQVEVDGGFDIPDGALAADMACAGGDHCVMCCQSHHLQGARTFLAVVEACECGDAGQCVMDDGGPCLRECAEHLQGADATPSTGDLCDQCLTSTLNDQVTPPGSCVKPVTAACNKSLDCALYVNCATQMGCNN